MHVMRELWRKGTIKGALCAICIGLGSSSQAAETVTYTYDALGRVKSAQFGGGPGNGVTRSYQYDHAGNRTQLVTTGASSSSGFNISPASNVANMVSNGVVIAVSVAGNGVPSGLVTFTENGVFLGSAYVFDNQASIFLQGLPVGRHTITASYSGDGSNEPYAHTFTIRVQNLSWLPAVLDLLLSN